MIIKKILFYLPILLLLNSCQKEAVNTMTTMMRETGDEELAGAVLDVFKVSNDIHNWKDFDAWMRQKIKGGEFNGKVKTGAMIHELQGVMVNSILSGPKTPLRAILGTTTNAYLNAFNEYVGSDQTWSSFPRAQFLLPECLGTLTDDGTWLTISRMADPNEDIEK